MAVDWPFTEISKVYKLGCSAFHDLTLAIAFLKEIELIPVLKLTVLISEYTGVSPSKSLTSISLLIEVGVLFLTFKFRSKYGMV